jgi:translation initiation factor IF-2
MYGEPVEAPGAVGMLHKVVVVGPHRSGKSTLLRTLTEDAISVERLGSSISLDFGRILVGPHDVTIFGVPGRRDFSFMRSILVKGADVCLLVIDSADSESFPEAKELYLNLRQRGRPIIIVANKQDKREALQPLLMRRVLDIEEEPLVPISAKTGEGLDELLETMADVLREGMQSGKG